MRKGKVVLGRRKGPLKGGGQALNTSVDSDGCGKFQSALFVVNRGFAHEGIGSSQSLHNEYGYP